MKIAIGAALAVALTGGIARAGDQCVSVGVDLTPTDYLQMVAWIEKADGTYVDTIYMTAKTGIYGLGNRPGRYDLNSGPVPDPVKHVDDMWPYGRRITTFPVWAHRHGMTFPLVVFQSGGEDSVSHPYGQSTPEHLPYCRPSSPRSEDCSQDTEHRPDELIWDTGTCASVAFTDKGVYSAEKSLYPPRADLTRQAGDSPSVASYRTTNPFDGVSRATPAGGAPTQLTWTLPADQGDYVLWVEVSKAFDFNGTYNDTTFPSPSVAFGTCGKPYRGQPSVVYRVPFTTGLATASTLDYVGYGDADGATGTLHPPDATITTDTPGSGALRLQLVSDSGMYRVRVTTTPQEDAAPPSAPHSMEAMSITSTTASLRFVEPGDDGDVGKVARYDVRVRADNEMTQDNFDDSMPVLARVEPAGAGQLTTVDIEGLLPETDYWIGVRATDDCFRTSPVEIIKVKTAERQVGEVDACFIATAAYGSVMANDVELLRHVRDSLLTSTVMGELFVETYYTFGPPVAGVVGQSDLLRASARAVLGPIVAAVRTLTY